MWPEIEHLRRVRAAKTRDLALRNTLEFFCDLSNFPSFLAAFRARYLNISNRMLISAQPQQPWLIYANVTLYCRPVGTPVTHTLLDKF